MDLIKYYEQKEGIIMKQIKISCIDDNEIENTEKSIKDIDNVRVLILSNSKINNQKRNIRKREK